VKASQARDITDSFLDGEMKDIFVDIEKHARCGSSFCYFDDWRITTEQAIYLSAMKYNVSFDSNMLNWKISW